MVPDASTGDQATQAALLTVRSGKCLQGSGKSAFVTGRLVLMDDVFVGNAINRTGRLAEKVFRRRFVAGFDSLAYTLDRGAHHGTHAGVVLVTGDRLAGALAGLGGIGHYVLTFPVTVVN